MTLPPLPEFVASNRTLGEVWDEIAPSFPPQLRRQFSDLLRMAGADMSVRSR